MARSSIGFGGGEAVVVALTLAETRKLIQKGLRSRSLVTVELGAGEVVVINPLQVKVLQEVERDGA